MEAPSRKTPESSFWRKSKEDTAKKELGPEMPQSDHGLHAQGVSKHRSGRAEVCFGDLERSRGGKVVC